MQRKHVVARKLQSATAYLGTAQEMYQDDEAAIDLLHPLTAVVSMLQEIRREILLQELRSVLHNADLPAAIRKKKVVAIFQLFMCQKIAQ
jgi:hypothetical protein